MRYFSDNKIFNKFSWQTLVTLTYVLTAFCQSIILTKYEIEENHQNSFNLSIICWIVATFLLVTMTINSYFLDDYLIGLFFEADSQYSQLLPLALISTIISTHFFTIFQAVFRAKGLIKRLSIFSMSF